MDTRALGAGYAHLISFEAEPEIAAANFTVDSDDPDLGDADIAAYKLPLYREFSTDDGTWGWYAQGSVSFLTLDETLNFEALPGETESLDFEWMAYGALVEFGLIFPFADGFSVAPGIGLGVSRVENDADFSNPYIEDALAPKLEGVLYNWETNASVARGNITLRYDKKHSSYRVKSNANISYSYIDSFGESQKFDGFSDHATTFNLKVDVSHPLNIEIWKRPVFIIGHIGNTSFLGSPPCERSRHMRSSTVFDDRPCPFSKRTHPEISIVFSPDQVPAASASTFVVDISVKNTGPYVASIVL